MTRNQPEQWVLDALAGVELDLSASTAPFDREGFLEWHVTGQVLVEPEHIAAPNGFARKVTALHGQPEFQRVAVFSMSGLKVNILDVDVHDALDEHSADAEVMTRLFDSDGEFSAEVEERLGGPVGGHSFLMIDRVWLTPRWRGFGIGRILTDKAIGMLTESPVSVVGVHSHPYEDWDEEQPDPSPEAIARTDHVWESLGFVRVAGQLFVRDESLIHSYADDRAIALGLMEGRGARSANAGADE